MLIFVVTPLRFVAGALMLAGIGACVGYVVRGGKTRDADKA